MITTLGVLAAVLTTVSWLPQVRRTLSTRSAGDFSWSYLWVLSAGVGCWAAYGVAREDLSIILANSLTLALLLAIVATKAHTERRARGSAGS
ncbi:SemiSWEET family sugar transporter [Streptoalloteichus hindustanus]|uniref:MtN3 and saliva related transmembrane protein n=1 Tax=Streptoalloteichus hindustanus TaxID=2017 RepID=A0A1M5GNA3_STRHI|nr:PQ-loop domain-containing transporter [Streptoalloteichus hindustanus]SHG05031.1 MtN3 and saliva related transmembrane protein [Streptoalloteichus hindustanus]